MSFVSLKNYLSSLAIKTEEKRYVLDFCKKLEYLEYLQKKAAAETHKNINTGYGNANSQICFVFQDIAEFAKAKPDVVKQLEKFLMNLWDVWITFIDKCDIDYVHKYEYLAHEIHCVNPKLMYVFSDENNSDVMDVMMNHMKNLGIQPPQIAYRINLNDLSSEDPEVRQHLWNRLRYLINYKTTDIKE